jgi:hypothetical protein
MTMINQRPSHPIPIKPEPHSNPTALVATISEQQRHLDFYMHEGELLLQGGVDSAASPQGYLIASVALYSYLRRHSPVLLTRGVTTAEIDAGGILIGHLRDLHAETQSSGGVLDGEVVGAAVARLTQARDIARRVLRPYPTLRCHFGLSNVVDPTLPATVVHAIDHFVAGAEAHLDKCHNRLLKSDLAELVAHRRRITDLTGEPPRPNPALLPTLLAVDAFFSSMAAAISGAFPKDDPRRIAGLKLIPRRGDRRGPSKAPRARLWRNSRPFSEE